MAAVTKTLLIIAGVIFPTLITFQSCKKISGSNNGATSATDILRIPDLKTKVTTSVSGFIAEQDGTPITGAVVKAGSIAVETDQFGYFEINNATLVKEAAVVTVEKPGYYTGTHTFTASSDQNEFFRMFLTPSSSYALKTIDASEGGTFSSWDGGSTFSINIPANGVVNAANNTPYKGLIYLNAFWVLTADAAFGCEVPGASLALDTSGFMRLISIHAMELVYVKGAAGEDLKLAAGKTATVTLELSSGSSDREPVTIPLWSFNNSNGLWKEEGIATKTTNVFTGVTRNLSSVCFGLPITFIHLRGKITDDSGKPVPYAAVNVYSTSNPLYPISAFSDSSGIVSELAPANTQLQMEISGLPGSGTAVISQRFFASVSDMSLSNLVVPSQSLVTLTGSVIDCGGKSINDGNVVVKQNTYSRGGYYHYAASGSGAFSFNFIYVKTYQTSDSLSILSQQKSTGQLGNALAIIPNKGNNNLGNLSTCGTSRNVQFSLAVLSGSGNPLPNIWAGITNVLTPADTLWFLTDSSGNVHGNLSENSSFILNITASKNCGNRLYTKTFSTNISNLSLGNIGVTGLAIANVAGTVVDCNGSAVTSGYLLVDKDGYRLNIPLSNSGTFAFNTNICNSTSDSISIIPVDGATGQAGRPKMISINEGNNAAGTLQACVTADLTKQYINYSVDGTNYSYSSPTVTISQSTDTYSAFNYILASSQPGDREVFISFLNSGKGVGSLNNLDEFHCPQLQWSIIPPISVSLTEYGPVGGYISGYFAGRVEQSETDTIGHAVVCSFRVKRSE